MGFIVDAENKLVMVDHSHNNFCVTSPKGNPVIQKLNNSLKVTSIFTRTKAKRERSLLGDNCPMLYALKGMHKLKTRRRDIALLCASFHRIFPVFLNDGFVWDWIVPLPSCHPICSRFAHKVHKHSQFGIVQPKTIIKVSAEQILLNVKQLNIKSADKALLSSDIRRFIKNNCLKTDFQIKALKSHLRHHINPFIWGSVLQDTVPPSKILLIDGMITSGSSLINASNILKHHYPHVEIEALTLFSSSR